MDNKKCRIETDIKDKFYKIENKNGKESNRNNLCYNKTSKEEDNLYIIDEIISYNSSPKLGLVSIKKTKNNDYSYISIGEDISNISNTITLNISMIQKEKSKKQITKDIEGRNTEIIKGNENLQDNDNLKESTSFANYKKLSNKDSNQYERDKRDKMKSFFKKKVTKIKNNKLNPSNSIEEIKRNNNIKKKTSKSKKKKTKKNIEKNIEKHFDTNRNHDHSKSSTNIGKEKNTKPKKSPKKNEIIDFQKLAKKKIDVEKEPKKKNKIDAGNSPKIIILDFSSSGNNEENESDYSIKEGSKINRKTESVKNFNSIEINEKFLNKKKNGENEFLLKKNKTKNEKNGNDDFYLTKNLSKKESLTEKKIIRPKTKNSCRLNSSYKMSQTKNIHQSNGRKLSANYGTNSIIKTKSIITMNPELMRKAAKKEKKRKQVEDFFNICSSKNFNHNEEFQNNIINVTALKENIRKKNKNKTKFKNKNDIRNESRKDSNKSCHNTPNKKFRHIVSHNYDKKIIPLEKKITANMSINNKPTDSSSLINTPKSIKNKKSSAHSNKNIANIKISSQAVNTKDIHLEMNGKQETIINYTNQEMVDDENEYMVECFKVLLKLDKDKQPRCKSKVNFNFENSPIEKNKKKIALFDLDETLVHCVKDKKGLNGDSVNIKLPTNKVVNVGLNIRPHWKEALDLIKKHYHIVIYTASHQSYADAVLDYMDKENKYFQYRLYRNHCVQCDVNGIKFYVKDLDTLNEKYNLKDVVLIDNSVLSFAYHLNNGIPIVPYIDQKEDSQLLMLAYYLVSIANFNDLTEENKKHINIEHFIEEVKNMDDEEENENEEETKDNTKIICEEKNEKINIKENQEKLNQDNIINKSKIEDNNKIDKNYKQEEKKEIESVKKNNSKKINSIKSEKGLKIANGMQKYMTDTYNKNN